MEEIDAIAFPQEAATSAVNNIVKQCPMRIAVIADIHSNDLALAAVLEDIKKTGVERIVHLGDAFNGPIDPCAVALMLKECNAVHVRGNGDRMVCDPAYLNPSKSALFARARLSGDTIAFAASWPAVFQQEDWLACHGSPRSDTEYLLEEVTPAGVCIKSPEKIIELLGGARASLVLCGHTHVPRVIGIPDGCVIVNPGSVGLSAYSEDLPVSHKMETGSPHARYAVVERTSAGWQVSLRAIPYDWERAAAIAMQNGFPDWAKPLLTGYA